MLKLLGARIRKAREESGISQKKLGMMLGLSDKAISSYESNRTFPPIDTLYRIAEELNQDITYFLTEDHGKIEVGTKINRIGLLLEKVSKEVENIKKSIEEK